MPVMTGCIEREFDGEVAIIDIMTKGEQQNIFAPEAQHENRWLWVSTPRSERTFLDIRRLHGAKTK
jgi:hypothetical protein